MTLLTIGEVANGKQTVFPTPAGIPQGVKVDGVAVTPQTHSECSVTFAQAPKEGALVEITVGRNVGMI